MKKFKKAILPIALSISVIGLAGCSAGGTKYISSKAGDVTEKDIVESIGASQLSKTATSMMIQKVLLDKYKNKIDSFVNNHYFALLILFTILLFISHRYDFIISKLNIVDSYSYALIANIDNVIFTFYFLLFIKKFNFDNKYLNFIGKISFELYMIHGLFMAIFGKYFVSSTINDMVYTALVLIFSISFAWFINKLLKKISL